MLTRSSLVSPAVKQEESGSTVKQEPQACQLPRKRGLELEPLTQGAKRVKKERVKAEGNTAHSSFDPFPSFARPLAADCVEVHRALASLHPEVIQRVAADTGGCGRNRLVLDALIGTILSQNTTDVNSARAFASLKQAFPEWEMARTAPTEDLAESIRRGGLAGEGLGATGRGRAVVRTSVSGMRCRADSALPCPSSVPVCPLCTPPVS